MKAEKSWRQALAVYLDRRALVLLFLGFSAGLPLLLIFSSLSLWLSEAGVKRGDVTMFSWAALGYSFKFIWAPLIDSLPLPGLTRWLGRRRAWLFTAQALIILAIVLMALINPINTQAQFLMAGAAVLLGFSSATQDIVIDAYRIEVGDGDLAIQPVLSATYIAGYRLGMIVAGAGALFLADFYGSSKEAYVYAAWQRTYLMMAAVMLVGMITTLSIREPQAAVRLSRPLHDNLRLVTLFAAMVAVFIAIFILAGRLPKAQGVLPAFLQESLRLLMAGGGAAVVAFVLVRSEHIPAALVQETWVAPVADFFRRYGKPAFLLLALIGLYRISDIVAGAISNLFYEHLGFSKTEIAKAVKTFGVIATIAGGFLGGIFAQRFPLMRMMMIGAVLTAATNVLFSLLEWTGLYTLVFGGIPVMLYGVVGFDNLAAGFAGAVFVAFLSALTNIRFTAMQYAIFSSLMTLIPKVLGGYSGAMVDGLGSYPAFFVLTAVLGIPVLVLVFLADRILFRKQEGVGRP